jgi:hypothetical protein
LQPGGAGSLRHPLAQPIGQLLQGSLVFKQRVRNVRRLQLLCFGQFYEHTKLDMHHCDSEPTSKPNAAPELPILDWVRLNFEYMNFE